MKAAEALRFLREVCGYNGVYLCGVFSMQTEQPAACKPIKVCLASIHY